MARLDGQLYCDSCTVPASLRQASLEAGKGRMFPWLLPRVPGGKAWPGKTVWGEKWRAAAVCNRRVVGQVF